MTLALGWVLFPLILLALSIGWGLVVELAAGARLPGALLPAAGIAALAAGIALVTRVAPALSLPVALAVAAGGLGAAAAGLGPRDGPRALVPRGPGAAAAAIAFALLAAPVVLSGAPAVSGYIRLDDSATFLALGDWVFDHGRGPTGLPPSTYEAMLQSYLGTGYPVGSMLPLVAAGRLTPVDLAWLWAPFLAFLGALLAGGLEVALRTAVRPPALRAAIAVAAACAALLLGYVLWGGVKEVWTAAITVSAAALATWTGAGIAAADGISRARRLVPLTVLAAGLVSALSVAGLVWVAPAVAAALAVLAAGRGYGRFVPAALAGVLLAGVVAYPLARLVPFVDLLIGARREGTERLGNLLEPLRVAQVLGIWPAEDFRVDPSAPAVTAALLALVVALAAWALVRAVRARDADVLALAGVLTAAAAIFAVSGWPWAEAKALAIASPVPLALAGAGGAALLARPGAARIAGALALAVVAGGVAWSYALAYHGTTLSPFGRHDELAQIGERFAGRGPALLPEFDPWAARWFLRAADPEGAAELRRRPASLADGGQLSKGQSGDLDQFAPETLNAYRLLVVRRSPVASRPPSTFTRVWRGPYYEVWERDDARGRVGGRLALGSTVDAGAVPACADVRRLAREAGPGAVLRAATAPAPIVAGLAPVAGWESAPGTVLPDGSGRARAVAVVDAGGRYDVWVGGAFRGRAAVSVDGRELDARGEGLAYAGPWLPFGSAGLAPGPHEIAIDLDAGPLVPGAGGVNRFPLGPVALVPADVEPEVVEVPAARAAELCGRRWDWVEAIA